MKNRNLGTFWAHEILNVCVGDDDDIENEDAVQPPRVHLCITFEAFAGGV